MDQKNDFAHRIIFNSKSIPNQFQINSTSIPHQVSKTDPKKYIYVSPTFAICFFHGILKRSFRARGTRFFFSFTIAETNGTDVAGRTACNVLKSSSQTGKTKRGSFLRLVLAFATGCTI
tara:strand:- start:63 stop:419 length:357 start_codon:yes stop_codon:yes gene_type:complete